MLPQLIFKSYSYSFSIAQYIKYSSCQGRMHTKHGSIYKQSRYLKQWRQRQCFLNETHLVTFEPETTGRPTYMIPLEIILHVDDKNVEFRSIFRIVTLEGREIFFDALCYGQKQSWIESIRDAVRARMGSRQSTDYRDIYQARSDAQQV